MYGVDMLCIIIVCVYTCTCTCVCVNVHVCMVYCVCTAHNKVCYYHTYKCQLQSYTGCMLLISPYCMHRILLSSCPGRGESENDVFDETWALDMAGLEWYFVNTTNSSDGPEGRIDAAGGVWGTRLWLSMGRTKNKRILSDTWVLNVTMSDDEEGSLELVG